VDEAPPDFTPVHLLTGFLGSGKTTLLRRLLTEPALADCAVLINEFGEVGLDHHLLERIDEATVLLPSGCVCCSIRGELSQAMASLLGRRTRGEIPGFRRMVIESTGLADPFPILSTLHADPVLRHHFKVGAVVTTVDAVNAASQLDGWEECVNQIAAADRLVLTKTDLATAEDIADLLPRLADLNPEAPLWRSAEVDAPAATLFSDVFSNPSGRFRASPAREGRYSGDRRSIHAFALVFEQPIDWTMFGVWLTMLLNRHGADILRVKGVLRLADVDTPVAIHGVRHLVHAPVHMGRWPDHNRDSRIVFIVRGLERDSIERSLRAFLALA
jgi:G3E family GTPase